jgi:hypothetical protein
MVPDDTTKNSQFQGHEIESLLRSQIANLINSAED